MKYSYAYKTSDGARHEAAMEAESREAVFVALRARGIKAIKVVAADGSKANGEVRRGARKRTIAAVAVAAAVLAGSAVYFLAPEREAGGRGEETPPTLEVAFTNDQYRAVFTNLEAKSEQILSKHAAAIAALDLDMLANYQSIESAEDAAPFSKKVRQGYKVVDDSRVEVRELFKTIFTAFPPECTAERDAAQELYAETMERLDSSERRIVKYEKALRLLVENRGKWHWRDGKVVWSDAALANEFEYFRRETSPLQKPRSIVIESQIVELPPTK